MLSCAGWGKLSLMCSELVLDQKVQGSSPASEKKTQMVAGSIPERSFAFHFFNLGLMNGYKLPILCLFALNHCVAAVRIYCFF